MSESLITQEPPASHGVASHCPYCALQCAMTLTPNSDASEPVTVTGREFPTNRGGLCRKGSSAAKVLGLGDRITQPMIRTAHGLEPTTWDHALTAITEAIRGTQREHGRDAVGIFGAGGLTNEKAYALGKFARAVLRTSRIDYNGRFCMSSAAAAGNRAFGLDRGLPFPLTDLDRAHAVLLIGSNVADTMPPFVQHLASAREHGGLFVIDLRESATADLTRSEERECGIHLAPTPGTDQELLLGLIHVVIAEGLYDAAYVASRTNGFARLKRTAQRYWPEHVQSLTGVPAAKIRAVARGLATAKDRGAFVLTGRGVEQHTNGSDTTSLAINLALLLGLPGREPGGYGTVTGQGNGQGGREHGQKCDQLPGYRSINDPQARAHVASVWGIDEQDIPGPGIDATQLLLSCGTDHGVRTLMIHGSNPVVSAPDATRVTRALADLDFLVVSDFVLSETAQLAHVILPVAQWAEEEGTMTNLEGRVIRRRRALPLPGAARDELAVLAELSTRLGSTMFFGTAEQMFEELTRASAGGRADYSGLSYDLLDQERACYWPYPAGSAGTPRLFRDSFPTADGRATLADVSPRAIAERIFDGAELTLITGRLLGHYQSGAQTRRVPELLASDPDGRVEINPETAHLYGVVEGQLLTLHNERGTVQARARLSRQIRRDTLFMPFHFAGSNSVNRLVSSATDPLSKMPEFKATRVWVSQEEQCVA